MQRRQSEQILDFIDLISAVGVCDPNAGKPRYDATSAARLTARPDLSERAYLLTVPFQAAVKSLSVERPVDGGAAEVHCRHDFEVVPSEAHRMGYCSWPTPRALHVRFGSEADI